MEYKEYLLSDEWKKKRKAVLKRAGYRCQLCNSNENLHVHHRTYENIFHEDLGDLTVLCGNCHKIFHNLKKILGLIGAFIINQDEMSKKNTN
jgi:5-methylcytosine-specific restriction endonuclease McrA